jgi:hypothetical protein
MVKIGFTKLLKYCNLTILGFQAIICLLGTFYKHIAFGWGLGDIIWYGIMYFLFVTHLVLTVKGKSKSNHYFGALTVIFFITTIYICLRATIWRGVEYRWNGNIFYN